MGESALDVLWLYGAPGVGKTTVAWELFLQMARDEIATGYVDIDQLGMCYGPPTPGNWAPEPHDDPGRHRLKARTLNAVVANFQDAGARCVIVPGVTDAVRGVETDLLPRARLTTCRLRAEPAELRRRLAARGQTGDFTAEVAYSDALDQTFATDPYVDTTELAVAEVVDQIRARTGWPRLATPVERPSVADFTPGEILWLCGPPAVGKSTVGWQVYQQLRQTGVNAAYVDLAQIGFRRPETAGNHRLKAANLAAVWRGFRAGGAQCLVAVGPLERPEQVTPYVEMLPAATITLCQLGASRQTLADRIVRRGNGVTSTVGLAGDELIGQPPERLREIADQATRTMNALDGLGNVRVETDDRPADEIAVEVIQGWSPLSDNHYLT
ncbi:hypothetical protein GCM10009765_49290 [Fodinicola feengrottensis]|uniref:AAA family ATPase n=2 Tax=Fodinicola feengrottensis TaxID=435914 RepID=A0ABN2HVD0_9ACTN